MTGRGDSAESNVPFRDVLTQRRSFDSLWLFSEIDIDQDNIIDLDLTLSRSAGDVSETHVSQNAAVDAPKGSESPQTRQVSRREQNKIAQRNFRARRDKHLAEINRQIAALERRKDALENENKQLLCRVRQKRGENEVLRRVRSLDFPSSSLEQLLLFDRGNDGESNKDDSRQGKGKAREVPVVRNPGHTPEVQRGLPIDSLMEVYDEFLEFWKRVSSHAMIKSGQAEPAAVIQQLTDFVKHEEAQIQSSNESDED